MRPRLPEIVKAMGPQRFPLMCEHCHVVAKYPRTYKLVNCDWPDHPRKRREGDRGSMGCWLCQACAEQYPMPKRFQPKPPDDQLSMFD